MILLQVWASGLFIRMRTSICILSSADLRESVGERRVRMECAVWSVQYMQAFSFLQDVGL
jgi:hypothetical protein